MAWRVDAGPARRRPESALLPLRGAAPERELPTFPGLVGELPGSDHRRGLVAARCLLRVHQATRSEDASAASLVLDRSTRTTAAHATHTSSTATGSTPSAARNSGLDTISGVG